MMLAKTTRNVNNNVEPKIKSEVVRGEQRVDEHPAHAVQVEDRLHDGEPTDEEREREPQDGDRHVERIATRMT